MGYIQPFTQDFTMCVTDKCGAMNVTDITDFTTKLYSDLTSITIEITFNGTAIGTGIVDITTEYIKTLTGTISCNGTTTIITGVNTLFLSECTVGKYLVLESTNEVVEIVSITSDTVMTVHEIPTTVAGDNAYQLDPCIVIDPADLTLLTFTDGRYDITITYVIGGTIYTKTKSFYSTCSIECCVWSSVEKIADYYSCNNCDTEYIQWASNMESIYKSLLYAASKFNFVEADRQLALLQKICIYKNCNCT